MHSESFDRLGSRDPFIRLNGLIRQRQRGLKRINTQTTLIVIKEIMPIVTITHLLIAKAINKPLILVRLRFQLVGTVPLHLPWWRQTIKLTIIYTERITLT